MQIFTLLDSRYHDIGIKVDLFSTNSFNQIIIRRQTYRLVPGKNLVAALEEQRVCSRLRKYRIPGHQMKGAVEPAVKTTVSATQHMWYKNAHETSYLYSGQFVKFF